MRQRLIFINILACSMLLSQVTWAATLEDGDFGYTAADQNEAAVTYGWVDMSTGTELDMIDDDQTGDLALGFTFTFYGEDYTTARVLSNGALVFNAITPYEFFQGTQCPLPFSSVVDGMIAFYQRDFNPADPACGEDCHIYWATGNDGTNDWFGVSYEAVPVWHEPEDPADPVTAQVILYDDGTIRIQIEDSGLETGADAMVGIEAPEGIAGISWTGCLTEGSLTDEMAIVFTPPTEGTPIVPMNQVGWNEPDNSVDFDFSAFNLDADEVIFDVTVAGNVWTTTPDPTTITLAAGANDEFAVSVAIPDTAVGGDADEATITLTPQGTGDPIDVTTLTLVQDDPDEWQPVTDMIILVDEPVVAGFGSTLYLFSGTYYDELAAQHYVTDIVQALHLDGEYIEWSYSYMCQSGSGWDADLDCCADESGGCSDPEDGTLVPMPDARANAAGCGMNDKVYIVGGQAVGETEVVSADTIFIYDTVANTWTIGAAMSEGRQGSAVVCDAARNTVYVIGGYGPYDAEGQANPVDTFWAYDAAANTWNTSLAQLSADWGRNSAQLIDADTILVAGGYYDGMVSTRTELYDIAGNAWSQTGDLPYERVLHGSALNADGRMCLIGGVSWGGGFTYDDDTFDCYADGYWIPQVAYLDEGRSQVVATTMGDAMYVVGGVLYNEEGPYVQVPSIERYPLTDDLPDEPPQPEVAPEAPPEMAPDAGTEGDGGSAAEVGPDAGTIEADAGSEVTPSSGGGSSDSGCCSVGAGHTPVPGYLALSLLLGLAVTLRRQRR